MRGLGVSEHAVCMCRMCMCTSCICFLHYKGCQRDFFSCVSDKGFGNMVQRGFFYTHIHLYIFLCVREREVSRCSDLTAVHCRVIYGCHPLTHTVKAKRFEALLDRTVNLSPPMQSKHLISWQSATAVSLASLPIKWFNPVAEDGAALAPTL